MTDRSIYPLIEQLSTAIESTVKTHSEPAVDVETLGRFASLIRVLAQIGQGSQAPSWEELLSLKAGLDPHKYALLCQSIEDLELALNYTGFEELREKAYASFSQSEMAARWLTSPHPKFEFMTPVQVYRSCESGRFEVLNELQAIRLGVVSPH